MPNFIINASPISGACKLADAGKQSAKKNLQLHNADLLSQAGDFISSVKHANTHKAAAAGKQHHRATTERTLGNAGSRTQSPLGNSAGVTCVGSPSPPRGESRGKAQTVPLAPHLSLLQSVVKLTCAPIGA